MVDYKAIIYASLILAFFLLSYFVVLKLRLEELFKQSAESKIRITFMLTGIMGILRSYIAIASGTAEENIKILTELTFTNLRRLAVVR